jgi:uncharacterized protein YecT (DUF1311 family)
MKTGYWLGFGIVISLSLIFPSVAQNAGQPSAFPKAKNCDRPTDREVAACTQQQAKAWDTILNAEYKAALGRVNENQRPLLVKAQRLWIQFRDAKCAVQRAHGGTISGYLVEQCLLETTQERAKQLRSLHTDETN